MKVAISLPDPIFEAAERLAQERNVPRSQLYAEALAAYVTSHGAAEITAKLNAVYGSESSRVEAPLARAQLRSLSDETW